MIEQFLIWSWGPSLWGWGIVFIMIFAVGLGIAMFELAENFKKKHKAYVNLHYEMTKGLKRLEALEAKFSPSTTTGGKDEAR